MQQESRQAGLNILHWFLDLIYSPLKYYKSFFTAGIFKKLKMQIQNINKPLYYVIMKYFTVKHIGLRDNNLTALIFLSHLRKSLESLSLNKLKC